MKYIDRSLVDAPANLQGLSSPTSAAAVQKSVYGHPDVKNALDQLQKGICCYCEAHYKATCPGDVEHFRPKGGYQQDEDDDFHYPGYYWLAYKWENLLYACEQCNRINKRNFFPLKDPAKRFNPAIKDISQEEPLLINPYEEKHPENHLTFVGTTIKALSDMGDASIKYYGLDRKELNEPRQGIYNDIIAFIDIAALLNGTPKEGKAQEMLKKRINEKIAEGQQTLMIKSNFGKYR